MSASLTSLLTVREIRNKILITLGLLLVYRIGFYIPLPGVNAQPFFDNLDGMGGGISSLSKS